MALLEIRWHGRGGQGAKTAALLFADAAIETGKYIQAFPEYGPERMGAPVFAFNRVSDEPILQHCGIKNPNIVVVLDPTLMETIGVTEGLPADGTILVNTQKTTDEIKKQLKLTTQKIYVVDASKISKEILGRELPNTPMLGALIKVSKLLEFEPMLKSVRKRLEKKFPGRPDVVEGNIKAIKRAYEEVQE
ncbi:pyruvate synthase [candidate division WOR-3 bacterium 4484_100]|uniref:Pyruvate synthase n=1 Tax=candidate division WOR-3 bacterium 4484_100 TaxID=1936077 RepID=A0A1V4QEA3_UNCW3|nr:MAG: pyruvate synthase [candidate division WOR-3 bacterium 4484_100]